MLAGKTVAMLFEKPSLRTRVSFEVGMKQLGGTAIYLSQAEVGLGQREPVQDVARVLSRYVAGIVARTYAQQSLRRPRRRRRRARRQRPLGRRAPLPGAGRPAHGA